MSQYIPTIGLEIHVELKTRSKMFCGCLNDPDEKHPNVNVCPVCLAHPGTLPTINEKAIEFVLKAGLALNGRIPKTSKFDRKNYLYPDLPKGYQISQYDQPLVSGGELNGVGITRIHLEEDTGRLVHSQDGESSLVDFNRAGVPLMELVTEPDVKSGREAVEFARELQLILRYLGISDADMEKGQMRVEVNISLSKNDEMGTKVELKNLNSFRAVQEAVDFETKRQTEILEKGDEVKQETRGWDDVKKKTVSQRSKEQAHDYRYFPEPDLPILSLKPSESDAEEIQNGASRLSERSEKGGIVPFNLEKLKDEIPELPAPKRERFKKEYNLTSEQAQILVEDKDMAEYFEESVSELSDELSGEKGDKQKALILLFNYLTSDLKGLMNEQKAGIRKLNVTPENFSDLIVLANKGEISSRLAKDILKEMSLSGLDPRRIIKEKGMEQISDESALEEIAKEVLQSNPKAVEDYKKGKENALQFLIGQAMAKSKGKGNPELFKQIIKKLVS